MPIDRILIVGFGSIGKRHLRLARGLMPHANIRVLRHQVSNEVPEFSDGCFFSIEEAIAFSPDIAVIASPAPFHLASAQALAEAGVHLLIEKPLSSSLDGVARLLETCDRKDVVLLVGYNLRFIESLQQYRNLLRQGIIGRVLSVRCEVGQYLPSWRPKIDYRRSVSARSELGGGVLLELSHELDYLRWIFGEVEWVNATLSRQSKLEINVEDSAYLNLGFSAAPDGYQLIGTVNLDYIRHDATRSCVAIGERGSLYWNALTGEVKIYEDGAKEWRMLFQQERKTDESYSGEWKNFISCINQNSIPLVNGKDGLKVLEIIEAVRKSAALGKKVHVKKCS